MKVKFKGRRWSIKAACDQLSIYMNLFGFVKGGHKKYQKLEDEPEGWPDEHSFVALKNPASVKLAIDSDIIESLLKFHRLDSMSHPYTFLLRLKKKMWTPKQFQKIVVPESQLLALT